MNSRIGGSLAGPGVICWFCVWTVYPGQGGCSRAQHRVCVCGCVGVGVGVGVPGGLASMRLCVSGRLGYVLFSLLSAGFTRLPNRLPRIKFCAERLDLGHVESGGDLRLPTADGRDNPMLVANRCACVYH
jgi:hypothetical protein